MKGNIQTFTLKGKYANVNGGDGKKIFVYTPEGYVYERGEDYPVMLCFDGQNAFTDCNGYSHEAVDTLSLDKIFEEKNKKVVVIGINNGEGEKTRNCQLTMSKKFGEVSNFEGDESFRQGVLEYFCEFLIDRVLPFVKEKFNLRYENNVISMGSSSGGLAALYIGLKYPDIFRAVMALSPATCLFSVKDWKTFLDTTKINAGAKYLIYCGKNTEDKLEEYLYNCSGDDYNLSASKIKELLVEYGAEKDMIKEAYKNGAYHNERAWHHAVNDNIDFIL